MKGRMVMTIASAAVLAAAAGQARADAGAPGSTFPEQPNGSVANACATLLSNPSQGSHDSATAAAIKVGLFTDACLGG
jgi:hypothetical protein